MAGKEESSSKLSDEEKALESLLDAFGSAFTLEELAYAYCKADKDAQIAAQLLVEMQRKDSSINGVTREREMAVVIGGNGSKSRLEKARNQPVSMGIVSSVIGKNYVWKPRSKNGSFDANKPVKLDSNELPESAIWGEEADLGSGKNDQVHQDMEEFLFRMLGDGFKLERDVIRDVLDACGYDMPESMEKLIGISTSASDRKNKSVCESADKHSVLGSQSQIRTGQQNSKCHLQGAEDEASKPKPKPKASSEQNHRIDLLREVLTALFSGTETKNDDSLPKTRSMPLRRPGLHGVPVTEPLYDSVFGNKTSAVRPQAQLQADYAKERMEQEKRFQAIRKAVKDYRVMMKEYYQSAVEAFRNGDQARAQKLLEQGCFFQTKAHEASEESSKMILEPRKVEAHEVLDLHDFAPREAIRLLKCHLLSFAGCQIKYLKVIIETEEEDSSKGSRKRLVLKLLQRESINWVEEENGNGGTILIQLDGTNIKNMSFAKK